jgi:hypothetical protein
MSVANQLKDMTIQDFVAADIQMIDCWPYEPTGLLIKHAGKEPDTDQMLKALNNDWNEIETFVERFSEKQKTSLSWVVAALIGVIGNLAVNLGFTSPVVGDNLWWVFVTLLVVALLIGLYLVFLPKVSMTFRFIPQYIDFPAGYEKHVPQKSCRNPYSSLVYQYATLNRLVAGFGTIVRLAVLKDRVLSTLKNASFIRISNVRKADIHLPVLYIEVSTKGTKPWLKPTSAKHIQKELRDMAQAMFDAHQLCSVRAFELDTAKWNNRGCDFLDAVSDWKYEEVQEILVNLLKGTVENER